MNVPRNRFLPPETSTNRGSGPPGHRLAESIPWNRFLGSIKYLKILPLFVFPFLKVLVKKYRNSVNFFYSACTLTVIQSFSQLNRHSHGLYNNLKALVNPYPKWKERNAFRTVKMLLESVRVVIEDIRIFIEAVCAGTSFLLRSCLAPDKSVHWERGKKSKQCKQT
jgi:hypothetical protein